jgi:putative SOS response-associated peptidase YedK
MCGRYVRRSDKQKIAEYFAVHGPSLPDFGPSWNVAPQTFQPIVRLNRDTGERELVLMRWGLIPFGTPLANSRTSLRNLPQTPFFGSWSSVR